MSGPQVGAPLGVAGPVMLGGVWVWADDFGGWSHMLQQCSDLVEQAFMARQRSITFQVQQGAGFVTYTIDFLNMTQVNTVTGFTRGVRRLLAAGAPLPANVWYFQDDNGTYHPIDDDVCALFDEMRARGTLVFGFNAGDSRFTYRADLSSMTQANLLTGKTRPLACQPRAGGLHNHQAQPQLQQQMMQFLPMPPAPHHGQPAHPSLFGNRPFGNPPLPGGPPQATPQGTGTTGRHPMDDVLAQCVDVTDQVASSEDNMCIICHCGFTPEERALKLPLCTHYFHHDCIRPWLVRQSKCPTCSQQYGVMTGDSPPGQMRVDTLLAGQCPLSGHEQYGTIRITFSIPGGIQQNEHPHPGTPFSGTTRVCYLPDEPQGRELLALVRRAWDQRLMFTVGRSITTGMDNTVVWNGIHMKTRTSGGETNHGYPDAGYFTRLRQELRSKGIV